MIASDGRRWHSGQARSLGLGRSEDHGGTGCGRNALAIRVGLAVAPGMVHAGPTLLFCLPAHVTNRHATRLTSSIPYG
jgi:hypothetical protein